MSSAKQKGNLLEDWVVQELKSSGLDLRAYRQKGSGSGLMKGDIWNDLNICFECKNTTELEIKTFLKQAIRESLGTQDPVVVWHPPRTPLEDSVAIMHFHYYKNLLIRSKRVSFTNPSEMNYKTRKLINDLKNFLKQLEI